MYTWPTTLDYRKSARIGSFIRMTEKPQSMCFETKRVPIKCIVQSQKISLSQQVYYSEVQKYHLILAICIDEVKNVTISTILYQ